MAYRQDHGSLKAERGSLAEDEAFLRESRKPHKVYALVLAAATVIAVFILFLPVIHFGPLPRPKPLSEYKTLLPWQGKTAEEPVEEAPKVIYFQARPSAEPTPPPAITGFRVLSFGRELGEDGFTTYVGDKPVTLTLEIVPFMSHPPVSWTVSDDTAASLSVSSDCKKCEFTALRNAGRIELRISCNEAEIVMPVYVWERPSETDG